MNINNTIYVIQYRTIFMIHVLYSSKDVCFCLMFPQTKYEYDLLLLRQNDSLFYLPMYITLLSYVFYTISMYTVSLIYLERGLCLENKLLTLSLNVKKNETNNYQHN